MNGDKATDSLSINNLNLEVSRHKALRTTQTKDIMQEDLLNAIYHSPAVNLLQSHMVHISSYLSNPSEMKT